ncbi:ferric uptake regulator family protein [Shuttleworthella sp. MSX8B]|uniref:Fur family transcriptional regulator n=1 Tax=Shuttleworthella sp. MSX8B TaxID=936574 RepID=UPI00045251FB|nr:transcriptional repressor [Shuttleworthia sp. MSX8B]EUB16257.1 ferric uptake regulator family protein [Shuttleworthia sp. MSX8B]
MTCSMKKAEYQTRQRRQLIDYMKSTGGKHFTASDVVRYCKEQELGIGMTTVYRQLDKLVSEGLVRKYLIDEKTAACFEYLGDQSKSCREHYHLKCESCGRLMHLDCQMIDAFVEHILDHHGFAINPARTTFFGLCQECRSRAESCAAD